MGCEGGSGVLGPLGLGGGTVGPGLGISGFLGGGGFSGGVGSGISFLLSCVVASIMPRQSKKPRWNPQLRGNLPRQQRVRGLKHNLPA